MGHNGSQHAMADLQQLTRSLFGFVESQEGFLLNAASEQFNRFIFTNTKNGIKLKSFQSF